MAAQEDGHVKLNTNEARQGKETGSVRYVLAISVGLAVIAGGVVWSIFFA